ncbi:MAG: histidine--tRNA ligase [Gammaproteobacteria bacterium]|nr:histidine--tRNA ligase [Gammaproteobacteria bacterium]
MPKVVPLVRGMRDLRSDEVNAIGFVESAFSDVLSSYGYEYIRLPVIEHTALFSRGLGEATDAVSKEMFSIIEESDALSLRPEGTASCARAVIDGNLYRGNKPKLWYAGSMFRRERPQRGRYREFYQVGAEAFGYEGPDIDAEFIRLVQDVWERLKIDHAITLEINTLGSAESRHAYRNALVEYLRPHKEALDEDSQRRLDLNPLRILDSKNQRTQEILQDAPLMEDFLDEHSLNHFKEFRNLLERHDIHGQVNSRLVRGLDYYTHAVFEWNTDLLGAQKQVGGGGRYDGLCELLGGNPCPGVGFAIGIDRVALLLQQLEIETPKAQPDAYILALSDDEQAFADKVSQQLRSETKLAVRSHLGGGKVKARMQMADRSGAEYALIIGAQEAACNHVAIKWLRAEREQITVPLAELSATLLNSD